MKPEPCTDIHKSPQKLKTHSSQAEIPLLEIVNLIFLAVPETLPRLQVLRQVGQPLLGNTDTLSPSNFYTANFYILAASLQVFCNQGKENTEVFWIGEQVLTNSFESWTMVQWVFLSNKAAWQTTLSSYLALPKCACYSPTCHYYILQTLGQWFLVFFIFQFYFKNSYSESARKLIQWNKDGCKAIKYKLENSELGLTWKTGFRYFVLKPRIKYIISFKINHYVFSNNCNN